MKTKDIMKKIAQRLLTLTAPLLLGGVGGGLLTSCSNDTDIPTLPKTENATIVEGVSLDPDVLFGIWEGETTTQGNTVSSTFSQTYRVEFTSVDDADAFYSHWYADARTNDRDSVINVEYAYQLSGSTVELTPKGNRQGIMKFVYTGDNKMECYAIAGNAINRICTLTRTSDPEPVITGVNRTMPQAGETVTVTGRNLQFVDHLFLPVQDGELEVADFTKDSKKITFVVPAATFKSGSIRCQSDGAHVSTYSPAYMFCDDCVFFSTFSTTGGTKPYYYGTDFENTIGINESLFSNAPVIDGGNIPEGHALDGMSVSNPTHFLSFFGNTPAPWAVDSKTDTDTGYLRFSTGDCFQRVLDKCGGQLTAQTKCTDAAIQMDIYVYSNGKPEWNTGYLSYRLNKSYSSLTNEMLANVAMWDQDTPVSFADGWLTFTIPLSAFKVTQNNGYDTLGGLISSLKKSNLQTIIKIVNYQLDDTHPAQALDSFQFCIANMRLVPYVLPANVRDEK